MTVVIPSFDSELPASMAGDAIAAVGAGAAVAGSLHLPGARGTVGEPAAADTLAASPPTAPNCGRANRSEVVTLAAEVARKWLLSGCGTAAAALASVASKSIGDREPASGGGGSGSGGGALQLPWVAGKPLVSVEPVRMSMWGRRFGSRTRPMRAHFWMFASNPCTRAGDTFNGGNGVGLETTKGCRPCHLFASVAAAAWDTKFTKA
mmetsp:Transcript_144112/g.359280  ORF Transcript_144112/g.359280 Transcript_144112/m.359280 type:complete len:207 (-) Transcript_144112:398-1018(-)